MTDNEIIKALKECQNIKSCGKCKLFTFEKGGAICSTYALDIITRQKAEIEKFKERCSRCGNKTTKAMLNTQEIFAEQSLENERLKAEIERLRSMNQAKLDVIHDLQDGNRKCVYLSDDETTEFCVDGPCPKYKTVGQIKSEAVKEFAERLCEGRVSNDPVVIAVKCELKEMAGED